MALKKIETIETEDIHALRFAYRELWCAVENGFTTDEFFKLRKRFRSLMQIIPYYEVQSPDGIGIYEECHNHSVEDAIKDFEGWVKQYDRQGYYSTPLYGNIPVPDIHKFCKIAEYYLVEPDGGVDEAYMSYTGRTFPVTLKQKGE